jgi:hypothetical protein
MLVVRPARSQSGAHQVGGCEQSQASPLAPARVELAQPIWMVQSLGSQPKKGSSTRFDGGPVRIMRLLISGHGNGARAKGADCVSRR